MNNKYIIIITVLVLISAISLAIFINTDESITDTSKNDKQIANEKEEAEFKKFYEDNIDNVSMTETEAINIAISISETEWDLISSKSANLFVYENSERKGIMYSVSIGGSYTYNRIDGTNYPEQMKHEVICIDAITGQKIDQNKILKTYSYGGIVNNIKEIMENRKNE